MRKDSELMENEANDIQACSKDVCDLPLLRQSKHCKLVFILHGQAYVFYKIQFDSFLTADWN